MLQSVHLAHANGRTLSLGKTEGAKESTAGVETTRQARPEKELARNNTQQSIREPASFYLASCSVAKSKSPFQATTKRAKILGQLV